MNKTLKNYIILAIALTIFILIRIFINNQINTNYNQYLQLSNELFYDKFNIWRTIYLSLNSLIYIFLAWIYVLTVFIKRRNANLNNEEYVKSINTYINVSKIVIIVGVLLNIMIFYISIGLDKYNLAKDLSTFSNGASIFILFITTFKKAKMESHVSEQ